ncbi:hypothetical protein Q9233_006662 [Columba guinea]|nr:hypothetical protein Q9233_006662 [Columba guinea]
MLSILFMLNFFLFSFFFFSRKTLQFQWTGAETGTFLLETNISGMQTPCELLWRVTLGYLNPKYTDDKDLVHEFVVAEGLTCLIKVGAEADQNYQNYILRALGQIMLYVDGMNGVINHNETIQWLYTLIGSKLLTLEEDFGCHFQSNTTIYIIKYDYVKLAIVPVY